MIILPVTSKPAGNRQGNDNWKIALGGSDKLQSEEQGEARSE